VKSIVFVPSAIRQWKKLAANVRKRIDARLKEFAASGKSDVKRLTGRKGARLRVGDWRVIFVEEDNTIVVVAVGHRREVYD
jgi:mRNA interferase RelE/StbE